MGSYNESAKILVSLALDKNDFKNDYHKLSELETYFKTINANITIDLRNVVINIRSVNSDSFIIGHLTQAVIGSQVIGEGVGGTGEYEDWMRRRWDWNSYEELNKGTLDDNVSIENGSITLK
jgi:hypothetical protein